jgi:hypothetical protein
LWVVCWQIDIPEEYRGEVEARMAAEEAQQGLTADGKPDLNKLKAAQLKEMCKAVGLKVRYPHG